MRDTFVPQDGQTPFVAGRPFFRVTFLGFRTSFIFRHLKQYAFMVCLLRRFLNPNTYIIRMLSIMQSPELKHAGIYFILGHFYLFIPFNLSDIMGQK